jgi:hypothetical protein
MDKFVQKKMQNFTIFFQALRIELETSIFFKKFLNLLNFHTLRRKTRVCDQLIDQMIKNTQYRFSRQLQSSVKMFGSNK